MKLSLSLKDFYELIILGPIGILPFVAGYLVLKNVPDISYWYASWNQPWGYITSVFIYDGLGNVEWYFVFLLLIWGGDFLGRSNNQKSRAIATAFAMFFPHSL